MGLVKDGQCSEGGGPRKGRSPAAERPRRLGLPLAASSSIPSALPGINGLASWPVSCIAGTVLVRTAGPAAHGSGGAGSLYTPFLDLRGHQCACTGKRPVSREEARSAYNSGGDKASFTSGVPHHTPPDLAVSAPLLSHTPTPVGSLVKAR